MAVLNHIRPRRDHRHHRAAPAVPEGTAALVTRVCLPEEEMGRTPAVTAPEARHPVPPEGVGECAFQLVGGLCRDGIFQHEPSVREQIVDMPPRAVRPVSVIAADMAGDPCESARPEGGAHIDIPPGGEGHIAPCPYPDHCSRGMQDEAVDPWFGHRGPVSVIADHPPCRLDMAKGVLGNRHPVTGPEFLHVKARETLKGLRERLL